jgi:hypothetical protein
MSPSLAGSRLARRWLSGITARQLALDEDGLSLSMLDLTQLASPTAEEPTKSVEHSPVERPVGLFDEMLDAALTSPHT